MTRFIVTPLIAGKTLMIHSRQKMIRLGKALELPERIENYGQEEKRG